MSRPDLNLLVTLEVLLAEGSVTRAARKLRLSPSAMSRALARLRLATGDPLLVRAGRQLVPSPRAIELRERVGALVQESEGVLRPAHALDLTRLERTFRLRVREGFVESFGAALLARTRSEAPGVRLHFLLKPDKDGAPLRDGSVDLDTGVVSATTSPELRTQALFRDRYVGVVRHGHPLTRGKLTAGRYADGAHIVVSRRGPDKGALDTALDAMGLSRNVAVLVDSFAAALGIVRGSDLVASVPERHTAALRGDLPVFALPFRVPAITVAMLWHPRQDADPAHRWLRRCLREVCAEKTAAVVPVRKPGAT